MRTQLREVIRDERAYWLDRARRMNQQAASREFMHGEQDAQAQEMREVARNFQQRAIGNPTPEVQETWL